jgi:hypothetical protein
MADHLDESVAKVELGSDGHERFVVVESPDLGDKWRMLVAAEAFHEDGPFIHPEDFDRLNGYVKATRKLDEHSELSFMLMAYGGSWNMSGVLPARAVCGEGDGTPTPPPTPARTASAAGTRRSDAGRREPARDGVHVVPAVASTALGPLEATSTRCTRTLQLFPNDGIARPSSPTGSKYGSQIEQDDTRTQSARTSRLTHKPSLGGHADAHDRRAAGPQRRHREPACTATEDRVRLDGIAEHPRPHLPTAHQRDRDSAPTPRRICAPARWLRFVLGARFDRIDVAVNNESQTAGRQGLGVRGAQAGLAEGDGHRLAGRRLGPLRELRARLSLERRAHAHRGAGRDDADRDGHGVRGGTTVRPLEGPLALRVGFLLDSRRSSRSTATPRRRPPRGRRERYGGEFTGRYNFDDRIFADASFTSAHARYTDAADIAAGTVYLTRRARPDFSAEPEAVSPIKGPHWTLIGSVHVRSMSDRYGDQLEPVAASSRPAWTVVNAESGASAGGTSSSSDRLPERRRT